MRTLHEELTKPIKVACKLCAFLATLNLDLLERWETELRLPVEEVGNTRVVYYLHTLGVDIEEASVRRHRSNHRGV